MVCHDAHKPRFVYWFQNDMACQNRKKLTHADMPMCTSSWPLKPDLPTYSKIVEIQQKQTK